MSNQLASKVFLCKRLRLGLGWSCLAIAVAAGCNSQTGDRGQVQPPATKEQASSQPQPKASATASLSLKTSSEVTLDQISDSMRAGRYEEADRFLRLKLAAEPHDPPLLFMAARSAHDQGRLDEAIELLEMIPPDHPEAGIPAMGQSADWLIEAERLLEAEAVLNQMHEIIGDAALIHRRLADLLNMQGRRVEAARHIHALIRLGDVTEKELLSLTTLSVPYHDDATVSRPPRRDEGGVEEKGRQVQEGDVTVVTDADTVDMRDLAGAKVLLVQEDLTAARRLAERLRKRYPDSAPVAAFQGRVYEALQANAELKRWSQSLPAGIEREAEYWTAMGNWMLRSNNPKPAVRAFCEAVLIDPTDRVAYLRLAEALASTGEMQTARRVTSRKDLLQQAWQLAINIGLHRKTRIADIESLAELLDQLDRPWEAVSWRFVAAHERGNLQEAMPALLARREELSELGLTGRVDRSDVRDALLCGIDLARWPLPPKGTGLLASSGGPVSSGGDLGSKPISRSDVSVSHPIRLVDIADQIGIDFRYHPNRESNPAHMRMSQVNGGGIAAIDMDLDGWIDLYFSDAGGRPFDAMDSEPNRLYRNIAGTFAQDVSLASGTDDRSYAAGVTAADLNQDGFGDLIVANLGENVQLINNGDGTFTRSLIAGSGGWTSSIVCGDIDGDHLPEMVEINYINDDEASTARCWGEGFDCSPRRFRPAADRFLKRDRDGSWVVAGTTDSSDGSANYGFAGLIANFDRRAGNDVFVTNDTTDNYFWLSEPRAGSTEWALTDQADLRGCAAGDAGQKQGCMGVAGGDFDRNGTLDLCVTNYWLESSNLYLQRLPGFFHDSAITFGLAAASRETVGFGIQACDFDRDGWLDLTVLNGHVFDPVENNTPEVPFQMLPQLFQGGPNGFSKVITSHVPASAVLNRSPSFWSKPVLGRTLMQLDWNRDGRPDLVANSLDAPIAVLENQTETGHWLRLDLIGTTSERDAIGAEVIVIRDDQKWHAWKLAGGYMGANQSTVDIGIGDGERVDRIEIVWPAGDRQVFNEVATDTHYVVVENQEQLERMDVPRR